MAKQKTKFSWKDHKKWLATFADAKTIVSAAESNKRKRIAKPKLTNK